MPGDKNVPMQVPINREYQQPPAPVQPPRQEFQPVPAPIMHPVMQPSQPVFAGKQNNTFLSCAFVIFNFLDVDLRSLGGVPDLRMSRMSQDLDMRQIPGPMTNSLPPPVVER